LEEGIFVKIDKVDVYLVSTSVKNPIADSTRKVETLGFAVTCLRTDDGLAGFGITYHEVGGEAIRQLILKDLAGQILGKNPFETEVVWEQVFHYFRGIARKGLAFCALSAIDIALWDLKGKALGMPLYRLLGGNKSRLPIYASGGWTSYDEGQLVAEMQSMVAQGYNMVKLKVGIKDGRAPYEDITRVRRVRQELGPNVGILLDANNAYKSATAVRVAHRLDDCNIYLFEEPVLADDMEGLSRVRQSIDIPVATGEHEYTKYGVRDLITHKAVDIVQVDVARCGGVTEWMKVAALTQAWNLAIAPHAMEYLHMHLLSVVPNGLFLERLLMFEPLNELIFVDPPRPKDGFLEIPEAPGLGLTLNQRNLEHYNE
jgi:D-arabinonate dehydratase